MLRTIVFCVALLASPTLLNSSSIPNSSENAAVESPETCTLATSNAITWFPKEVTCPVCDTKNIFMQWGSYGSYIYQYPSKYQLVFWPYTASPAWYSCKKCRYSTFMDHFEILSKDKIAAVKEALKEITLPAQTERSEKESLESPPYLEIPISARIVAAEQIYRALGQTDPEFWSHHYRVVGYHFAREKHEKKAEEARRQALAFAEGLLNDKKHKDQRKELLYIAGAMRHFLKDDPGALKDLTEAKELTFVNSKLEADQSKGYDAYLSDVIKEYLEMLQQGKGPRTKEGEEDPHE